MKKILFFVVLLTILGTVAFYLYQKPAEKISDNNIEEVNVGGKTVKDNIYTIDGKPITLVNGLSEIEIPGSTSKKVTRYFGNGAVGDLNGDDKEDVAFLLTQTSGGSGNFYYVVVALADDKGYRGINAILLGDRIAPQTTEINEGQIVVNYADRKKDEPFAVEPSVGVSRYFQVVNNQLTEVEVSSQVKINNRDWKWVNTVSSDEVIIPQKTGAFSLNLKDDGSVSGTTDCNGFSGRYEISGNKLSFSSLVSTEMFCEGSQENMFAQLLAEVESYSLNEEKNLVFQLKDGLGSMFFE